MNSKIIILNEQNMETKVINGSFEIKSGSITVSDPCYNISTFGALEAEVINGTWKYEVKIERGRVHYIRAWHKDAKKGIIREMSTIATICVDSASCGFFDSEYYEEKHKNGQLDEKWYNEYVCKRKDDWINCENKGIVVTSGFGDGEYMLKVRYGMLSLLEEVYLRFI